MEETEIIFEKAMSIWWSFLWRSIIASLLCAFALRFIGGFIVGVGDRSDFPSDVVIPFAILVSIPVCVWALKAALSKQHGGYSVALVKAS